jgi:hypothetical protein
LGNIAAAKTRQRKKLKLFAKILRGAYTKKNTIHDPELYVKIVDELGERELEVAFLLYDVKVIQKRKFEIHAGEQGNDAYIFSKYYPVYAEDELKFILPRLEKTGVIKEIVGMFTGYMGGAYNPTPLMVHLVKYIENNE